MNATAALRTKFFMIGALYTFDDVCDPLNELPGALAEICFASFHIDVYIIALNNSTIDLFLSRSYRIFIPWLLIR